MPSKKCHGCGACTRIRTQVRHKPHHNRSSTSTLIIYSSHISINHAAQAFPSSIHRGCCIDQHAPTGAG
eukprot:scaffold38721_cov200-Skeletonema_dohrnii-CCMP3373.AAC.2